MAGGWSQLQRRLPPAGQLFQALSAAVHCCVRRFTPPIASRSNAALSVPACREGVVKGLVDRSGLNAEFVGDLAAVDDEWFLELVLHLSEFPHCVLIMPSARSILAGPRGGEDAVTEIRLRAAAWSEVSDARPIATSTRSAAIKGLGKVPTTFVDGVQFRHALRPNDAPMLFGE
jgi:hypothetical protein